jgi:hypothetical protein
MACDIQCLKERKLKVLLGAYTDAASKAGSDPEKYEQTKIAYFSLRDGPTWTENYRKQKEEQAQKQLKRKQAGNTHSPQQEPITEDSYEFTKYLQAKQDKQSVKQRVLEFGGLQSSNWFQWLELGLTIGLIVYILYQAFTKYPKVLNYFNGNS